MRVFLDANVLFSAAKSSGAVRHLVERMVDKGHECWADAYVVEEARRNLVAKAPASLSDLDHVLTRIRVAPLHVGRGGVAAVHGLAEKDRPVVAAAIALSCDVLVTGDRTHFGGLYGQAIESVVIESPRTLYEKLFSI
jgi:predicted nucleic acid-binding protein